MLFDELEWSETYIKQHVSDHSGLHFRQFLLKTIIGQPCASPLPSQFTHLEATVPDSTIEGISQEMQNEENDLHDRTIDNLLSIELSLIRNLIRDFLGHEALWYHSRFILHMLHSRQTANPNNPECSSVALTGPILKKTRTDCTIEDEPMVFNWKGCRSKVMEEELSFTNDILAKYPLQHFAACHKRWLLHFFGFEH